MDTKKKLPVAKKKRAEQRMDWDSLPLLLTMHEVANILRISRAGAYNFVNAGCLAKVTVGKRIFVLRDTLRRFVEGNA